MIVYQNDQTRIPRAEQQLLIAITETPSLAKCTPDSLVMCVRDSLEIGLDLSKRLGQAYIVPYGNTAQLIIGYRGMILISGRAGMTVLAGVVHENDGFVWQVGTESICIHTPGWTERGEPMGVFAVAHLLDGRTLQERMSWDEVDAIRRKSKAGQSGPWIDFPSEMAKKTVIRRLFKCLPTTTDLLIRAAEIDRDDYLDTTATEVAPKATGSRADQLRSKLGMTSPKAEQQPDQHDDYEEGSNQPF